MSNEVNDLILAAKISGATGFPQRYKSVSPREMLRARPANFYDFENGITGTPFQSHLTNSSAVQSIITAGGKTCARLTAQGAAATKCAIHMNRSPTGSSGTQWYAGYGIMRWEANISVNALSTVAEEYSLRVGFNDRADDADSNFVGFEYRRGTSVNWQAVCMKAGTPTKQSGLVAVAASNPVTLGFVMNAAGNSCQFFIDGVAKGSPITTNIPNSILNSMGQVVSVNISATAGAIAKTFDVDWISDDLQLTTPR